MFIQSVAVLVEQDGKVLLIQEGGGTAKGLWCLPLGHVDSGETAAEAAVREATEETGYVVSIIQGLGSVQLSGSEYKGRADEGDLNFEVSFFKGKITGGGLKPGPTELDARWFTREEITKLPLRGEWLKPILGL